jgi:hypothetical protein
VSEEYRLTIKRSDRKKTIGIQVFDGEVQITCPKSATDLDCRQLLETRRKWIRKALGDLANQPKALIHSYKDGDLWLFRGSTYSLMLNNLIKGVRVVDSRIEVGCQKQNGPVYVRRMLESWLRAQALERLIERTSDFSSLMGVTPGLIKIRTYRARWGSCSSSGLVSYNWRLIHAPDDVLDYVVAHELGHLVHFNHSKEFWHFVEIYQPDWRTQRAWLKNHSRLLLES